MGHPAHIPKIFGFGRGGKKKPTVKAVDKPKPALNDDKSTAITKTETGNYSSNFSKTPKMTPEFSTYPSYFEGPGAIHNRDLRWDGHNQPIEYILGASPGFAQFAQGDEKLTTTGLGRKIAKASRMGFDFAMIDFEALSEMYEPDLKGLIDRIKKSQGNDHTGTHFEIGIHLPTDMDLCIANAFQWKQMQEKLIRGAYSSAALVKSRFYLFHTSSNIRPHVTFKVGQQEPRVAQVSHDGVNLGMFMTRVDRKADSTYIDPKYEDKGPVLIEKTPDGNNWEGMADWFKAKYISVLFNVLGAAGDPTLISDLETRMADNTISGLKNGKEKVQEELNKLRRNSWAVVKADQLAEHDALIQQHKAEINDWEEKKKTANENTKQQLQSQIDNSKLYLEKYELEKKSMQNANQIEDLEIDAKTIGKFDYNLIQKLKILQEVRLNGGEKHPNIEATPTYQKFMKLAKIRGTFEHYDFDQIFDFWKTHGSECEERVSYHVIAKYMWLTEDPFWKDIVGMEYDPDRILKSADEDEEYYPENESGKKIAILVENLITAVACKYIEGHLFTTDHTRNMNSLPEQRIINHVKKVKNAVAGQANCEKATSVYWYTRFNKIQIYIETAMPPQGQEGQLRIMNANDHVRLAKHLDGGLYTSYTMDFEHLMDNFIDPGTDIETLADGDGKYITMLHVNAPRPVMGAHAPLDTISNDQILLYRWIYALKQKGMDNAYIIWEMGSYGSRDSATAFRRLIDCLRNNKAPNNLPTEFFGIDATFEAQQHVAIQEHAYDPLEGVLVIPEESHSLLSSAAKDKGKLAEWVREKFR